MKIYNSALELVGNTPLLNASRFCRVNDLNSSIFAKLEYFNPAGSVKDRVALKMILDAEEDGRLKPGGTIIEPTSGNTGIGLSYIGVLKGYNVIITMPDTMSQERIKTMEAYGAKVILTNGALGMKGAIAEAERINNATPNSLVMGQFESPSNPEAHYLTTGPEIWNDLDGNIDILVSAVGTGGTLSGTGKFLKEKNPQVKIVAVEPENSAVLSGKNAGAHKIQGIGAGFIPKTLDLTVIDEIITVSDEDAYKYGKEFSKCESVLIGISSGAALAAAVKLAKLPENANKKIVVILADTGSRYLSTPNYF